MTYPMTIASLNSSGKRLNRMRRRGRKVNRLTLSAIPLLMLTACTSQALTEGQSWSVTSAEVSLVSERPIPCGILFTSTAVKLQTKDKETMWVYLPCGIGFARIVEPEDTFPKPGMTCDANGTVEAGAITGTDKGPWSSEPLARHVDKMTCSNPQYILEY